MLLMIDNYDSFTFNVVQYLAELGEEVQVFRNDEVSLEAIAEMAPETLVISPGPCTPNEAGISMDAVKRFAGEIPILGICLGHQSIGQVYGGQIVKADRVMHGKTSPIHHNGEDLFRDLPDPFTATRYHSLVINRESIPDCLKVVAWTVDEQGRQDEIMGVRHRDLPVYGVQFHPESILTDHGHKLLGNFLALAKGEV